MVAVVVAFSRRGDEEDATTLGVFVASSPLSFLLLRLPTTSSQRTLLYLKGDLDRSRTHATTAESVRRGVFLRVSRRVDRAQLLRAGFKHPEYEYDDDDDDDDDGFCHQRKRRKRKVKKTTRLSSSRAEREVRRTRPERK